MKQKRSIAVGILLAVSLFVVSVALAQSRQVFGGSGVLERLDILGGTVVLSDQKYAISPSVPVYLFNPDIQDPDLQRDERRRRSTADLRQGMMVGYNVKDKATIAELWLLTPAARQMLRRQNAE